MSFDRARALRLAKLAKLAYEQDDRRLAAGVGALGYDRIQHFDDDRTDTQAIVVSNASEAVFVSRGTERKAADILTDLKFRREDMAASGQGGVHRGFLAAWRSIEPGVKTALNRFANAGVPVGAAGHSLGGALTIIAAAESSAIRYVVSFGAPRVGDATFAANCRTGEKRFGHDRIVRAADVVPLLPLIAMGFTHDRASVYIGPDGRIAEDFGLLAEAWGRARSLVDLDWTRAPIGFGIGPVQFLPGRAVKDHLIDSYIEGLSA